MANKALNIIDIDYQKLDIFYNTLSKDMANTTSLISNFAGTVFVANTNGKYRIAGSTLLLLNNLYFIEEALRNNPDPIFISQMSIFSYLSVKTIHNELKNFNKKQINKTIKKIPSRLKSFLSTKNKSIKKGLKRFGYDILDKFKKNEDSFSSAFLILAGYALSKYNIDYDVLKTGISIVAEKSPEIFATTTAIMGVNEISKGKLFNAGNFFMASNLTWFTHANSDYHQLSTVIFTYSSALTAKNGLEMLNGKDTFIDDFIKKINNLRKKFKKKEKSKEIITF
jgi:hypothetical protein